MLHYVFAFIYLLLRLSNRETQLKEKEKNQEINLICIYLIAARVVHKINPNHVFDLNA